MNIVTAANAMRFNLNQRVKPCADSIKIRVKASDPLDASLVAIFAQIEALNTTICAFIETAEKRGQ